ncbi:MAG: hypothetical protein R3358_03255, partial [Woeseiaceae bacterium]|nr:hypothetical protein [Woeseiaceae bacterium]
MSYDQTHWVPVQRRGPLPTYYYHEHFVEMLDFVDEHYQHVFLEEHDAFVRDFRELPLDAQRLYVRLINRRGRVFARNRLRYPDLGDVSVPLEALQDNGWVGHPRAEYFNEILSFVTRDDLYRILAQRFTGLAKSLKKSQLVDFARANMAPQDLVDALQTRRIVVQRRGHELGYLMYLFFGRIRHSLSQFTMRDLGLVRTQSLGAGYEPRFSERDEALESYFFASRLDELR